MLKLNVEQDSFLYLEKEKNIIRFKKELLMIKKPFIFLSVYGFCKGVIYWYSFLSLQEFMRF